MEQEVLDGKLAGSMYGVVDAHPPALQSANAITASA